MAKRSKRQTSVKSSLLVLLLILILLISSTYAWFTANLKVEISSLDVHVDAANGIQISTDAEHWKTQITNEDIITNAYKNNKNQLPTNLVPVSTDGTVSAGYLNMYYGELAASGGGLGLTAIKEGPESNGGAGAQTGKYIAFDIFLKVTDTTQVYLAQDSKVATSLDSTDKGLQNAARVALLDEGNAADGQAAGTYTGLTNASSSIIWEPNADKHTATAISNAAGILGTPGIKDGTIYNTFGINKPIPSPVASDKLLSVANGEFTEITPAIQSKAAGVTENTALINLKSGITKVRVYMWIEGQDLDCENSASGSNITFDLKMEIKAK